jgi:hypothetical protein
MGESLATKLFPERDQSSRDAVTKEFTLTIDQDVEHMEEILDTWTAELKRNVLVREEMKITICFQDLFL